MKIIADQDNTDYYYHAAIVCIEEAKEGNTIWNLIRAIQLLLLALGSKTCTK